MQAPLATANFVSLARCGFYDGIWFHRVLAGFVIQAGDPGTKRQNRATSTGSAPAARVRLRDRAPGRGAALRPVRGRDGEQHGRTNGSQFFIDLVDLDAQLRAVGVYTIFGGGHRGHRGGRRDRRRPGQRPAMPASRSSRRDRVDRDHRIGVTGGVRGVLIGRIGVRTALQGKGISTSETLSKRNARSILTWAVRTAIHYWSQGHG